MSASGLPGGPDRHPGRPSRATPPAPGRRRAWIDRRTLIAMLAGALVSAGVFMGLAWNPRTTTPNGRGVDVQTPHWVPPTTWDLRGASARTKYLAIDNWVFHTQTGGDPGQVHNVLQTIAALPTAFDNLKHYAIGYVGDTAREDLVPDLLPGLSPAVSGVETRQHIVAVIYHLAARKGYAVIPNSVKPALSTYLASGVETDPTVQTYVTRLLAGLP